MMVICAFGNTWKYSLSTGAGRWARTILNFLIFSFRPQSFVFVSFIYKREKKEVERRFACSTVRL